MPRPKLHPVALAFEWVAKITTVGLEMVIPGLFGYWLDGKLGTRYLTIAGFALGMVVGFWHLLRMVKLKPPRKNEPPDS
jgi:hypothetical protein